MADVALAAGRLIRDDREGIRLGACPGRGRDGHDRPPGDQPGIVVGKIEDRRLVHRPQVERLGRVHRRSAADRHDDGPLDPELAQGLGGALDGLGAGVRFDLVEGPDLDACPRQDAQHAIDHAGGAHARIGHDENA